MKSLEKARKEYNLSQDELATKTNLTQYTITMIESGKSAAKPENRRALEKALNQHIDWLSTSKFKVFGQGQSSAWELAEQKRLQATSDFKEGIAASSESRKPNFTRS